MLLYMRLWLNCDASVESKSSSASSESCVFLPSAIASSDSFHAKNKW